MKKLLLLPLCIISLYNFAQSVSGDWEGQLTVQGTILPIIFHIKDSTGILSATFDSPKQVAYGLPCSDVTVKDDSLLIGMKMLNGKYTGLLHSNRRRVTGTWYQGDLSLPLDLKKIKDSATPKTFNRPQTPKAPFPYFSEEVTYSNSDGSIRFGGTLTRPLDKVLKKYPSVILITGSGQQDRDETLFEHKPFAVIADHFTKNGFAVLRVDDRGVGKTTGKFSKSTSADFADDVAAGIQFLKTHINIDTTRIGLLGHSEGGMIAPIVAARRTDVKFIVLLAAPGVPIIDLMATQAVDVAAASGVAKSDMGTYGTLYKNLVTTVINEEDTAVAFVKAMGVLDYWRKSTPAATVENTTGISNDATAATFADAFVKQMIEPWFNYFMHFKPADYLSQVKCPVLALNGAGDIQVAAEPNIQAIKNILEKKALPHFEAVIVPGLNHLFQHCNSCSVDEYMTIEETIAPEVLQHITKWMQQVTVK